MPVPRPPALEHAEPTIIALALVAFAISTGASIYVLLPKTRRFIFSLQGSAVYEELFEFSDDLPEVHRRLAYDLDRFWDENDKTMTNLFRAFRFAAVGLAIEVLLLLTSLGKRYCFLEMAGTQKPNGPPPPPPPTPGIGRPETHGGKPDAKK